MDKTIRVLLSVVVLVFSQTLMAAQPKITSITLTKTGYIINGTNFGTNKSFVRVQEGRAMRSGSVILSTTPNRISVRSRLKNGAKIKVFIGRSASNRFRYRAAVKSTAKATTRKPVAVKQPVKTRAQTSVQQKPLTPRLPSKSNIDKAATKRVGNPAEGATQNNLAEGVVDTDPSSKRAQEGRINPGIDMSLDKSGVQYDQVGIKNESQLEAMEKERERLNEVQIIGGLDGRNDAQDGGSATSPGAGLPKGVGDPSGMISDEIVKGTAGTETLYSSTEGVKSTSAQRETAKAAEGTFMGALAKLFTRPDRFKGIFDDEPRTRAEWMQKVNAIQNSKTMSDKEKERAMTKLAAEIEKVSKEAAEKEAAAKKKEEDAAGKPIDQYEKVEMKGLDKFTSEEKERKQKAMAGANIDYGDNVQGATNTLDTSAEKARVDGMTGQFEPGYQAPGTVTEADKQRLIEKGGPGTRF